MTKIEYLRQDTALNNIYTWKSLAGVLSTGKGLTITDSTKVYNADMIYYVEIPTSALNGYLLYCNKEYIGNINWLSGSLYDYDYGEISFGNNIVSPYFIVLLTYNEVQEVGIDVKLPPSFIPYENLNNTDSGKVTISEDDYQRCLSVLGGPFITDEELEYTRDEICNLAIRPALEEYFHWLPALINDEVSVSTNGQEVDMPPEAYACVGISLQQYGGSISGNILSPLFYGMEQAMYSGFNYTNLTGAYYGSSRPKTNMSSLDSALSGRASSQALINYTRRVHYEGPYNRVTTIPDNGKKKKEIQRYIKVYSNTMGTFNIWWAKRTLDFNDVEFSDRTRVFDYAQACVKELFGNLRRQIKTDVPGLYDYGKWIEEAKVTKENITKEYKAIVKSSGVIRGSL